LVIATVVSVAFAVSVPPAAAQARGGRGTGSAEGATTPRADARIELAGYWVSVVTEDWRWRMVTPEKGDYASIPITSEGRRVADLWDPAKDEASGNQCRAYGVGGIMRVPRRLHVTWDSDTTLKIETDAGTQTRLLRFDAAAPPSGDLGWQGYSVASWQGPAQTAQGPRGGALKVVTTRARAGYLRKNGVPYSDRAVVNEYFHRTKEQNGDEWLIVTTIVDDARYLLQPFITSTHFKKEPDGAKFTPMGCHTDPPRTDKPLVN